MCLLHWHKSATAWQHKNSRQATVGSRASRIQKAIIVSKARATKDKPVSSRTAPDVLEAFGGAAEVVDADWPPEEAELTWFELGDPVGVLPGVSGAGSVAEVGVPLADPPVEEVVEVVDGVVPEGSASWASPVHWLVANQLSSRQNHLPTLF